MGLRWRSLTAAGRRRQAADDLERRLRAAARRSAVPVAEPRIPAGQVGTFTLVPRTPPAVTLRARSWWPAADLPVPRRPVDPRVTRAISAMRREQLRRPEPDTISSNGGGGGDG